MADRRAGRIGRRDFLAFATALGIPASAFGPMPRPAWADDASRIPGRAALRIQMDLRPLGDPRLYSWSEMGNATRGLLDYLVRSHPDGRFTGGLLSHWEVLDNAQTYILHLRKDATWNTGAPVTAEDVVANLHGWADATLTGNSMATRLAALVDPMTRRARHGAIAARGPDRVEVRLSRPDVTFIAGLSDYPAAVQRADLVGRDPLEHNVGSGAYRIASYEPGNRAVLQRRPGRHRRAPALEDIDFVDLGPDPEIWLEAARAGRIDMITRSEPAFMAAFEAIGWRRHGVASATTVVVRPNQAALLRGDRPYADARVRRALALAVDNAVCLELGAGGHGVVAENHHVAPVQPDYAPLPPRAPDRSAAVRLMAEAGKAEFVHDIISVDDLWRRDTADVVSAQLTDAGIPNRRMIVPRAAFAEAWTRYPLSTTNWNHRALGIEVLSLAYRSGAPWNETGFANPRFDALLDTAAGTVADADRRPVMARLQRLLQEEGVVIQPFWQTLYRHAAADVTGAEMNPNFEIDPHDLGRR